MTGLALDQSNWQPLLAKDPRLFEVLTLYGTEDGFETLLAKKYSLEQHKMFAAGLADTVRVIHAFWLRQRQPSPSH